MTSNLKASAQQRKPSTWLKRQPTQWKKIFASHVPDKELISKMYEEPSNSIATTTTIQLKVGRGSE